MSPSVPGQLYGERAAHVGPLAPSFPEAVSGWPRGGYGWPGSARKHPGSLSVPPLLPPPPPSSRTERWTPHMLGPPTGTGAQALRDTTTVNAVNANEAGGRALPPAENSAHLHCPMMGALKGLENAREEESLLLAQQPDLAEMRTRRWRLRGRRTWVAAVEGTGWSPGGGRTQASSAETGRVLLTQGQGSLCWGPGTGRPLCPCPTPSEAGPWLLGAPVA